MKLKELSQFLTREISSSQLKLSIAKEVQEYKKATDIIGGSAKVVFRSQNSKLFVGKKDVWRLGRAFISSQLDVWDIYYICDALSMSQDVKFAHEGVEEAVNRMTDPTVNGDLTSERVHEIFQEIA